MKSDNNTSLMGQEARQYDYDRWLATLFAPAEVRESFFTLLAFNIELSRIRETVSEPMLGDIRLQWWREAISGLQNGSLKSHPVIEALDFVNRQKSVDFGLMLDMIDIRSKDLDPTPMTDDTDLLIYADGTGGALHRLMLPLLGVDASSAALEAANLAGRVFALAGIMRAIPFHYRHNLVLLPVKRMEAIGVTRDTVFQIEHQDNYRRIVAELCKLAEKNMQEAHLAGKSMSHHGRPVLLINALSTLYLKRLRKAGFEPAHSGLMIGSPRKILALFLYSMRRG